MTDYLIHFNSNHSPRNGQFIRGDGDNDGIVNDHAHRRKGDRRRDPRSHKPENRIGVEKSKDKDPHRVIIPRSTNGDGNSRSRRQAIYYSRDKNAYVTKDPNISANGKVTNREFTRVGTGKTVRIGDTKGYVSGSSRNVTFKERESIPGKITTVGNRDFVKSNSGKSSNANSAYTSKGSNYVTSVKNVSVRKLVNDEEDKKNRSDYDPMDYRHRESDTYDHMHYNPYQSRSYQTAEDKQQHWEDAQKGLSNNKGTYIDKYKKTR